MSNFTQMQEMLVEFAKERDWEKFHTPKNLSMALSVEAAELLEIMQWLSDDEIKQLTLRRDKDFLKKVGDEVADVFVYLMRLCTVLDLDLVTCFKDKMQENAKKYPADKVRGSAKKYSDY